MRLTVVGARECAPLCMCEATYARAVRRVWNETKGIITIAVVAVIAAEFAHVFREVILWFVRTAYGNENSTEAMATTRAVLPIAYISVGLLLARRLNAMAEAWRGGRIGLTALEAAAHHKGPGSSLRGTLLKASATLAACMPGTSLGRESAILETGGAVGFAAGRWTGVDPVSLGCAGVAAAFASAYHAPFGAIAYVGGHLGVWRNRRAMAYAALGSLLSDYVTVTYLGGHPIFPGAHGSVGATIVLGLIAIVPAVVGARLFVRVRETVPSLVVVRNHPLVFLAAGIVISAVTVVIAPLSAGNGMEALRHVAVSGSIAAAISMGVGKLIATSATLGTRSPGGVFSPTLAVAAGWVLATFVGLEALGLDLPGTHWDGIVVGMAAGLAVGLHLPILAAVVVAEMCGQMSLVPFTAVAALLAHLLISLIDSAEESHNITVPLEVHAEDA